MSLPLYVNSDNLLQLKKLKLAADDSYVNDATVTFTLKDADEDVVAGASAISMPYVASSNGWYQGTLQSTVSLTGGHKYILEIDAVSGENVLHKRITCYATYKGAAA